MCQHPCTLLLGGPLLIREQCAPSADKSQAVGKLRGGKAHPGCSSGRLLSGTEELTCGVLRQRRQSLGLPDGDTDPFFQLHGGAAWEVWHTAILLSVPVHDLPALVVSSNFLSHFCSSCACSEEKSLSGEEVCRLFRGHMLLCRSGQELRQRCPTLQEQEEPPELLTARQQLADMTSGDESQIADAAVTEGVHGSGTPM